uniref:C3H1-type domain-containing protein n=1 Tax=Panagrellus redivivus TaxID=6233 RepID=A0A7E4V8U3_PANRE
MIDATPTDRAEAKALQVGNKDNQTTTAVTLGTARPLQLGQAYISDGLCRPQNGLCGNDHYLYLKRILFGLQTTI